MTRVVTFLLCVWGACGGTLSCLVVWHVSNDFNASLDLHSIGRTRIPRVLTFDPFTERRDGGLSQDVSGLRVFIVENA